MTQIPRPILLLFLLLTTPFLSASVYTSITSNAHYNGIESDIYFYHSDHLGSASWITEHHGAPIQYIHYLPYGEILANQKASTYNERFKFTGKELDAESGYYFFNARYLLSELGDFLSVDPLSDKAPCIQPYLYCNGNPLRYIDPDGRNPIYSPDGEFLGVNESGLQGEAFIMESKDYYLGMSNEDSRKLNQGINILSERARAKYESHFNTLSSRPDWDGILTLKEANSWYRGGSGEALYVDLKEIDLSGVLSLGERYVGQLKSVNLLLNSNSIENGLVYGNITLRRHPNNQVKAFPDTYNFEMHPWGNPINWGRNLETLIGRKVAGTGVPYTINFYGSKTLTPLMPWLK